MFSNLCDCAWSVGDLDVRAYLQDEVVPRVPCHRKEMCVRFWVPNCPYIFTAKDIINFVTYIYCCYWPMRQTKIKKFINTIFL